jgi:transcriptional regulator with XRE-family HTH domain
MTTKNNLWQARKRIGLERKQVAFLLSHKTTDDISRYEKGNSLPNLNTALKLEIIYRVPIRLLFQSLFEEYREEIFALKKRQSVTFAQNLNKIPKAADELKQEESCFYADILKSHVPSRLELEAVTRHTISLINTVSDYKQGKNPFSD